MRRSKQQTAETRQKIIQAASALFKERGIDGVSVAEIMDKAGLTHGGFYKHFESKEALLTEAIAAAFAESMCAWEAAMAKQEDKIQTAQDLIALYLTDDHKKDYAHGCPVPALVSEITRQTGNPKRSFAEGVKGMIGVFEELYEGKNSPDQKDLASTTVACLIGTLMLARCADSDKTAQGYLDATRNTLFRILPENEKDISLENKN